jgi:mono/diheme cytochrome c family protein
LTWLLAVALVLGALGLVACRDDQEPDSSGDQAASGETSDDAEKDAGEGNGEAADEESDEATSVASARQTTWTLVSEKCSECHELDVVTEARMDWDDWAASVDHMVDKGAELTDIEQDAIVSYLSTRQEVAARGFAIVEEECVVCHTLTVIDEARNDWDGWETAVEHMIEQGASLDQEQAEAVVEYLATSESP